MRDSSRSGLSFHEFSHPARRWAYSHIEKLAGRYCDRVVFANDEERRLSVKSGWLPAEKCLTIPNGVDFSKFAQRNRNDIRDRFRIKFGFKPDEVLIVFTARFEAQKQPLIVPEIAAELAKRRPDARWRFVVVGEGSLGDALRRRIDELQLGHRIQLLGWQDDPTLAPLSADIALHPTLWEGMPLTLLDAHAAGLPSVASDIKGNREVVTPETGFLCPPREVNAYVRSLARLIDDPLLRLRLGRAARIRSEQHFDVTVNAGRVVSLYEQMLGMPATERDEDRRYRDHLHVNYDNRHAEFDRKAA